MIFPKRGNGGSFKREKTFSQEFFKKFAFSKTFLVFKVKEIFLICVLITFFLFFGLFSSGLLLAFLRFPNIRFAFPLFESTSGYGGGGCDDPLFSGVVPVPNAEVSSFDRISFSVPLTTPNESIRVEVNGAVSYLIFQNFSA